MWRKLEDLTNTIGAFVEQRDDLLLVVSCADAEVVYVLKTLEGIDDASASDLVLTFAEPFVGEAQYAAAIVAHLRAQMKAVPRKERGLLSPFPAICDDASARPGARVRAAVDHVSSMVPPEGGHRILWGLLPLEVKDHEGYARLVGELIPWKGPELWMRGLRVIARDDRSAPFLFPGLRKTKAPGVQLFEMDMSTPALNDALVKEAADKTRPVADRMQALLQLAGIDFAYRRYPQAMEKYGRLYNYYAEHDAKAMQALTLQGAGDCLWRTGDKKGAKLRYQQALTRALEAKSLPVLVGLTGTLGDFSMETGELREADGYYGLAAQIAGKVLNPVAHADALEKQGVARDKNGDPAGAVLVWRDAAKVCKAWNYHERRRSLLGRLIAAYKGLHMDDERKAAEEELETLAGQIKVATHDHASQKTAS